MRSKPIIYALDDQRYSGIQAVRYVGQTTNAQQRLAQHMNEKSNNVGKNAWIQELRGIGMKPGIRAIEIVTVPMFARDREEYWIHHYLSQGARLLNIVFTTTNTDPSNKVGDRIRRFVSKQLTLGAMPSPVKIMCHCQCSRNTAIHYRDEVLLSNNISLDMADNQW
jgi:GIY-YIG catalytic domain